MQSRLSGSLASSKKSWTLKIKHMWAHKVRLCPCLWFLTRSMSMFCAGGVTSARSTVGFLGRRLWGRGRLLAAPTASVEAHRDSSTRTANIQRHTPAILLMMTVLFKWGWNVAVLTLFSPPFLFLYFCLSATQLFPACFTQSPIQTQKNCIKRQKSMRQTTGGRGWLGMFNINLVYRQNEVMLQLCSAHIRTTGGGHPYWILAFSADRLKGHQSGQIDRI